MEIRTYQACDLEEILDLFYNTVHTVNAVDYTKEQLHAWADGKPDADKWDKSLSEHISLVVTEQGRLIGFGDITAEGYLDRLYVHKDCQRRGVATMLCDRLEESTAADCIQTHASITARPFFERRGYRAVGEQQVERSGVYLTNFVMEKRRKGLNQSQAIGECIK